MHFEMLRQILLDPTREWHEIESFEHRMFLGRPYWGKDSRKAVKKPEPIDEEDGPLVVPIGSAEELLLAQRQFILPLSMAAELNKQFFKLLQDEQE